MTDFRWPDGVRCAVFVSVNFDAETYDLKSTTEDRLYGRFSYGRYGVRAGLPRVLAMLQRCGARATFFVAGSDAARHAGAVREIHDAGHEIAARGADLAPLPTLGDGEAAALRRGRDVLAGITGVQPLGFRAAAGEISPRTLDHLARLGFAYDSSFQDDDHPYVFAASDGANIVEIPTVSSLDDSFPYSARHTHARVLKIWAEEFDALYAAGCLMPLTLHLRGDVGTSRAARIAALEELLMHVAGRPGVRFMTGGELAAHTRALGGTPEANPYLVHREVLDRTPYRGDLAIKPLGA